MKLINIHRASLIAICLLSQAAISEVHIENPEWSLQDDFEGSENKEFWIPGREVYHGAACTSAPGYKGKVLKFNYEKDNPEPNHGWSEKRFKLPINARQIEISYKLYVPPNYVHAPGNHKNFVLWSGDYGSKGNIFVSSESWPVSGGVRPSMNIMADGRNYGHSRVPNGPKMYVDRQGNWQNMHIYIELAKNENDVGLMEVHRNGALVIGTQYPNIERGYTAAPPVNEQLHFSTRGNYLDRGYLLGWVNGGFQETTVFCLDDFSIKASSQIDNVSLSSPPKKPPTVAISSR